MLDSFLVENRAEIIERARGKVVARGSPELSAEAQAANGAPAFLDQLVDALRRSHAKDPDDQTAIVRSGAQHGHDLLLIGLSIAQVVRDYGDVCQSITELAVERTIVISPDDFQTLNLCLDEATAGAVTAYAHQNARVSADASTERLATLAHELRNVLNTATLAYEAMKSGRVPIGGNTGLLLGRSLTGLRDLIDRSLADVRLDAGIERLERIPVVAFLEEVEIGARIQAETRHVELTVAPIDRAVTIDGDRQILAAALANLLQNAFKFTPKGGRVSLTTRVSDDRVLFEVEDECGGLPPGKTEDLFRPFEQRGSDRSGIGLGLTICRRAAKAHGGDISARDLPGKGCVFTFTLPKSPARDSHPGST